MNKLGWVIAVVMVLTVVGILFGNRDPQAAERSHDRQAIAECKKELADELTPADQRRFIRGVCDKMEADYRDKWGRNP